MKIINISYRLPISFQRKEDVLETRISSGGLVSAVLSLKNEKNELHWLGVADFSRADFQEGKDKFRDTFVLHPVFLSKTVNYGFYNGFSNAVLWPLFHYFPSFVEFKPGNFKSYMEANRILSEEASKIAEEGDIIWIHDYQLLPMAAMIRDMNPQAKIGFFLHIPFPSYELIRLLPKYCRDVLVKSMLGADLIGFHTYEYAQHFLSTVQMIEGLQHRQFNLLHKNRNIRVGVFPISIDYEKFDRALTDPEIAGEKKRLRQFYEDKKIIFSVDRLDYTKGIIYRLKGFAHFLNHYPEWNGKIVFILVAVPSRIAIKKYIERKQMIEGLISEINGRFGNTQWTPVIYQYGSLNFTELAGLYTGCDIALISPLRDGMNLVAKEFVASRSDEDGVLLLSDMTGAAKELTDALLFNPLDEEEIAAKIKMAIDMPDTERNTRMVNMRTQVKKHHILKWGNDFIDELEDTCKAKIFPDLLHKEKKEAILLTYKKARKRLILLDYDGTLAAFQVVPELAVPTPEVLTLLSALSADNMNQVVLISGRDRHTLEKWFGHLPLVLIAEHGSFIKKQTWNSTLTDGILWKEGVRNIMQTFADNCSGAFVEEKTFALCWHYRNTEESSGFSQSRELISLLSDYLTGAGASVIDGNKVIEIKPAQINKGNAVLQAFNLKDYDFCVAIGDDRTDEDLFEVINRFKGITIKAGESGSMAQYRISTIPSVISFLNQLQQQNHDAGSTT
jgi:trehalose 6-phosphate synthase/phosphatase